MDRGYRMLALIPTETVYGVAVAVNAFSDAVPQDTSEFPSWPRDPQATVNGAAVPALGTGYRRIFTLKQRELTQTVAWLVDDDRPESSFPCQPVLWNFCLY